jgi:hypothetical protein
MLRLQRASKGDKLNSLTAMFLNGWYKDKFNILVDLPVTTTKTLLVFSIQTELAKREAFRKLSQKSYTALIDVVSSSLGALDDKAMRKAISQAGLDLDSEAINSVLSDIKKEVSKQITGAGIASILVNDVLSAKMGRVEQIKDISFSSIVESVSRVQELYGDFASGASLAVVGEKIKSMMTSVQLIKHVYDIWVTFNRHKSATVKGRLTYALDTLYESTFGRPMVSLETQAQGMHYHVTSVDLLKNLTYRQVVCTYFVSLRGLLGIEQTEGEVSTKLSDLLDHFLLNTPDQLPTLPKELACTSGEMKEAQSVFARLWLMNVYEMILTHDEGQLSHQINNVMEERKYTRNETWDKMIKEGISISSILFSAYVKTGSQFRDWAKNENIYFSNDPTISHNVKRKLNKFVFEVVQGYNTFLNMEHTRFLYNPAHIVNYAENSGPGDEIQYFIPDREMRFERAQWIIDENLNRTLIYKNQKIQGSDIDVSIDIKRPLLQMATAIKPLLGLTITRPTLFGGDISTAFLGIQSVDKLMKTTIIPSEILAQSELVLIKDVVDFAQTFDVSEEIAEMCFVEPGMYASLSRQATVFVTWDFETAPVVEFSSVEDSRDYVPFISRYPYLLVYRNTLPSIAGLPGDGSGKKKNEPKNDPIVGDPKDDKKDDKDSKDEKDEKDEKDPK